MRVLHVFSRQGCHLCEVLLEELLPLVRGVLDVEVRDIDARADWRAAYSTRVPVVEFEGRVICEHRLDRAAIAGLREAVVAQRER